MPEDLSPSIGYGNPAYHQAAVQVRYEPQWQARTASLPPYPPVEFVEEPPVRTGNEATIAEMEALNDSFEQGADEPAPKGGLVVNRRGAPSDVLGAREAMRPRAARG